MLSLEITKASFSLEEFIAIHSSTKPSIDKKDDTEDTNESSSSTSSSEENEDEYPTEGEE